MPYLLPQRQESRAQRRDAAAVPHQRQQFQVGKAGYNIIALTIAKTVEGVHMRGGAVDQPGPHDFAGRGVRFWFHIVTLVRRFAVPDNRQMRAPVRSLWVNDDNCRQLHYKRKLAAGEGEICVSRTSAGMDCLRGNGCLGHLATVKSGQRRYNVATKQEGLCEFL